jgi:hypothetical protein
MSNGGTNGLLTALALVGAAGRVESGEQEQLDMLEADEAMPSMLPEPAGSATRSGPRGGRPAGARNKSTEAWRELFLSKFRHPMMVLGELTARTPEQLARDLKLYKFHEGRLVLAPILDENGVHARDADGEKRWQPVLATGEAAKMQQDAATALLPYLGQKLPMAIEVTAPQRGVVVIGSLDVAGGQGDLAVPFAPDEPTEQNQQVSEAEVVRLEREQSHETDKPQTSLGEFKDDV